MPSDGVPLLNRSASIALLVALPLAAVPPLPAGRAEPLPAAAEPLSCPPPERTRPAALSSQLLPPSPAAADGVAPAAAGRDYRHRLARPAAGWPTRRHWCVWLEPLDARGPQTRWDRRWMEAVRAALGRWDRELAIRTVDDPAAAQVRILRQRPPLRRDRHDRPRASHGRATLQVMEVRRRGTWWLEPHVTVLISPDQRAAAIEATALHELGHAFGLWGHSENPGDAMAAVPNARPVVDLTDNDRSTLRWLYAQPTPFRRPLPDQPGGDPAPPDRNPDPDRGITP
jgi:hypothetical protein